MAKDLLTQSQVLTERRPTSRIVQFARVVYLVLAVLFVGGVILQVFFAGGAILVGSNYLVDHREFGGSLARLPVFMVITSLLARLSIRFVLLSVLLFVLYSMQFIIVHAFTAMGLPAAFRALHAVNALALFWLSLEIVKSTWRLLHAERAN